MTHGRLSHSLRQRILFLLLGNLGLLLLVWLLLKPGSSFADVLGRAGPSMAPTLMAGLGMTGIIYTGAIDLSVASIIAVSGTVFGIAAHRGWPAPVCFLACAGGATALSVLNGFVIRWSRLPAIIVTLAGLAIYRGVALIMADAAVQGFPGYFSIAAEVLRGPGRDYAGLLVALTVGIGLTWEWGARLPRIWQALGSSEEAVRLAGLAPARIQLQAFLVGGMFLGVAALVYVTRITAIEPSRVALGFELSVIGAVVLGGTNIFGGEGTYLGTMLGASFLHFVGEVMVFGGVSPYWQEVVTGAVILLVIGLDCAWHRRRKSMEELA